MFLDWWHLPPMLIFVNQALWASSHCWNQRGENIYHVEAATIGLNSCLIKCYAFHNMGLCSVWKLPKLTDARRLFIFLSKLCKSCGRIIFPFCACVKIVKVWNRSAEDESFARDEKSAKCKFIDFSHLSEAGWWEVVSYKGIKSQMWECCQGECFVDAPPPQ